MLGELVFCVLSYIPYLLIEYAGLAKLHGYLPWTLPAILVNLLPAAQPAMGLRDLIGLGIWMGGLGFEMVADRRESPLCPSLTWHH